MNGEIRFRSVTIQCSAGMGSSLVSALLGATGTNPDVFEVETEGVRLTGYGENAEGETVYFVADHSTETTCHAWMDADRKSQHYPVAEEYICRLLARACEAKL